MFLNKNNTQSELKSLIIDTRKREKIKKERINFKWVGIVAIIAFSISFGLSFVSEMTIPHLPLWLGIIITLLFIMLGILFDIIGVAVTTADEKVFHSMNSRKVKGASLAVTFKKSSDKVATFCNDVVGDVCGIISGAAGTSIAAILIKDFNCNPLFTSLTVAAIIASLTIGGKSIGKSFAINKSNIILYEFAKFISNFYKNN